MLWAYMKLQHTLWELVLSFNHMNSVHLIGVTHKCLDPLSHFEGLWVFCFETGAQESQGGFDLNN